MLLPLASHVAKDGAEIDGQASCFGEGGCGIGEHQDLPVSFMRLTPRRHHEWIVDRHTNDQFNAEAMGTGQKGAMSREKDLESR